MAKSELSGRCAIAGSNSIVIYLAFFLPMAASRTRAAQDRLITDIGTVSALVTIAGVIGALVMYWAVRHTPLRFLFERPERFWIAPRPRLNLQPAAQTAP